MSPSKEDYLKEIYKLGGSQTLVANKSIAEKLGVSPASVTEMLGKLGREDLIHYEAYKGSRLTPAGLTAALSLVRSHRLWEVFLIRYLAYSWSEAHEDAELLEHETPPRLTEKLDVFLDHPLFCPHGNSIPHKDGQIEDIVMRPMTLLEPGETSHVRRVTEEKALMDYLQGAGIRIGSTVTVISIGAYEGPLELDIDGKRATISYKAACRVYVDQRNV